MTLAERWRAEGEAKGEARGRLEGQRALLQRQLRLKFGELSPQVVERLVLATSADLAVWAERVLSAESLDAVFAE